MSRTFALIPAAGKSRRMGKPKLAMALGERTVLEWVLEAMKQAGIGEIVVVVGPQGEELAALAEKAKAHVLRLENDTPDMQATVLLGLAPADHPTLNSAVVMELLKAKKEHPAQSIFIPSHAGRRGHPALIAWQHVPGLRLWPPGQGLNRFLRRLAAQTRECPMDDPEVLCDLDTLEDFQRVLQQLRDWEKVQK